MKIWFLGVLLALVSCTGGVSRAKEPAGLIPEEKMIDIITELSVYEAYYQQKYNHVAVFHAVVRKTGKFLFKKYKVTEENYRASFNYYAQHQEKMDAIYKAVVERLNVETKKIGEQSQKTNLK